MLALGKYEVSFVADVFRSLGHEIHCGRNRLVGYMV